MTPRGSSARRLLVVATASVVIVGVGPADASADDPVSAVAQYVEMVPTPSGPRPTQRAQAVEMTPAQLPAPILAQVQAEPRGEALETVATSPALGAPPEPAPPPAAQDDEPVEAMASYEAARFADPRADPFDTGPLAGTVGSAVVPSTRLLALAGLLVLLAGTALAAAVVRARRAR